MILCSFNSTEPDEFMANLILIRHAQASLLSQNYDQLSETGLYQSTLLGKYFADISLSTNRIIRGSLKRHQQTADGICESLSKPSDIEVDDRWNEFDFKTLIKAYLATYHDQPLAYDNKTDPKIFFSILKKAIKAWSEGLIDNENMESWQHFHQRINNALEDICTVSEKTDTILVVSSGGAISMALKQVLQIDADKMIDLNFQIKNSSFSSMEIKKDRLVLSSFNQVPHLELKERQSLITYA
jgi:broad specificity phosphatase PhoE